MGYKKGDIFYYSFPERETKFKDKTRVIKNEHPVVVLHTRETPNKTVLIAPITEPKNLIDKDKVPENYVLLKYDEYPFALTKDCYINLDQIMVIDEDELEVIERKGFRIVAPLNKIDLYKLDFRLMLTYEMQNYFENEKTLEKNNDINTIIQHIDINVKQDIESLLDKHKIKNLQDREEFLFVMDELINILKKYYIDDNAKEGTY